MKPEEIINQNIEEDDEIDLSRVFMNLKRHWLTLLVSLLIGGILAGVGSYCLITPQFESTAVMFILTKETTLTSLADLQIGSQLTNDYQVVVTSRTVLQETLKDLNIESIYDYKQLKGKLTVNNPQNTRILEITAKDPDPEMAKGIADAIAKNSAEYIADTMEITPPKIIETGEVATKKSSPKNGRNALIGAIAGLCIAVAYVVISTVLNDSVTTVDDVEKYLGLSVLASLPDRSLNSDDRKKKIKRLKRKKRIIKRNENSRAKKAKRE